MDWSTQMKMDGVDRGGRKPPVPSHPPPGPIGRDTDVRPRGPSVDRRLRRRRRLKRVGLVALVAHAVRDLGQPGVAGTGPRRHPGPAAPVRRIRPREVRVLLAVPVAAAGRVGRPGSRAVRGPPAVAAQGSVDARVGHARVRRPRPPARPACRGARPRPRGPLRPGRPSAPAVILRRRRGRCGPAGPGSDTKAKPDETAAATWQ